MTVFAVTLARPRRVCRSGGAAPATGVTPPVAGVEQRPQAAAANVTFQSGSASPGNDGAVTQTIAAAAVAAAAQTQYQPPALQYQPPRGDTPRRHRHLAAHASSLRPRPRRRYEPVAPSLPSTWTWRLDVDVWRYHRQRYHQNDRYRIQEWVVDAGISEGCARHPRHCRTNATWVIQPPQSGGPELAWTPPTPPTLPTPPTCPPAARADAGPPDTPTCARPDDSTAGLAARARAGCAAPPADGDPGAAARPMSLLLLPPRPATPPPFRIRYAAGVAGRPGSRGAAPTRAAVAALIAGSRTTAPRPSHFFGNSGRRPPVAAPRAAAGAPAQAPASPPRSRSGLLELPGVAVLRLPAGRRGPRAQVDDTLTRPG